MSYAVEFAQKLNTKFQARTNFTPMDVRAGRKYDKIMHDGSVYAFVDKQTGELVKAATYSAPARRADGTTAGKYFLNSVAGQEHAAHNADLYGSFLYSDYTPSAVPVMAL